MYQTPFQESSPPDYEASGSEVDSDNQPRMSHLLRRSRSLTDADLTDELQPSGRHLSFFSQRKSKPIQEQPAPSTRDTGRSFTTSGKSLSGLLPSQALVSEPDSKPPTGSKRAEAKSVRAKGDSDTDATVSKPKSARWWSWSGSSKAMKPDSKALPAPQGIRSPAGKEAGSNSRPSSLDLQGQPGHSSGGASAALAQTSPLAQPGCMSMFTAGPGQPEKPVSEVQWAGEHVPCLLFPPIHPLLSLMLGHDQVKGPSAYICNFATRSHHAHACFAITHARNF